MDTLSASTAPNNLADLLTNLGDIAAERIPMQPIGTATEEDVLRGLNCEPKRLLELVDGVLVEKAMGFEESCLATWLISLLDRHVRSANLGLVTSPDGPWRLRPGRVRMPDVAFIAWDRLPGRRRPKDAMPSAAPNLAIEILSESNSPTEMRQKRSDYFEAGVELVWEINPKDRTVAVYKSTDSPADILSSSDTLDGGEVLPGFALQVEELFAELDRHG